MKILMVINSSAYGLDSTFNALRLLESLAKKENVEVTAFLMGDGVTDAINNQITPDGFYKLDRMLTIAMHHGAQVLCCGTCIDARGITEQMLVKGATRSTLSALTDLTVESDKVLVF